MSTSKAQEQARSVSRGRETFKSTGRGGVGNIRASPSTGPQGDTETLPPRGREVASKPNQTPSVGRGGVGNIRSHSRARAASKVPEGFPQTQSLVSEQQANTAAYEQQVIEEAALANVVHSSGRGGAGNISGSRSRSRGPGKLFGGGSDSPRHSTGRGGVGNIFLGADGATPVEELGDVYRTVHSTDGIHSTGRGGAANMTDLHSPPPEVHAHQQSDFESSGRGGRGNIRSRSTSREASRSASRDRLSKIWQKVAHHQQHDAPQDIREVQEPAPSNE
ncbi:hypothetical protein BC835DRAFT_1418718 [Cytidiella melzeri]|nr:hypothetical protein BC835DRAFT_1418718 [Cytidiella melzeri]